MAVAKWATPSARSSNFLSTSANGIVTSTESTVVTYDNSALRNLYGAVTIKLGSINSTAGGSITLRVTVNDGTDTADRGAGDLYTATLVSGTSAKVVVIPMVRLYPFSLRFSIINNSGATLAGSGNEIYVTPYNEEIV